MSSSFGFVIVRSFTEPEERDRETWRTAARRPGEALKSKTSDALLLGGARIAGAPDEGGRRKTAEVERTG